MAKPEYVYRVTLEKENKLGFRTWKRKRVVPMATRQRVGCILGFQAQLESHDRHQVTIERAPVGEWAEVDVRDL